MAIGNMGVNSYDSARTEQKIDITYEDFHTIARSEKQLSFVAFSIPLIFLVSQAGLEDIFVGRSVSN
jgi:hypothetical protein